MASLKPTGFEGLKNWYNKVTGENYVTDDGYTTGGLGNYATYDGIGINKEAYDAIQGAGGDALLKKNPSIEVGGLQTGLQGLQALSGIANAYTGHKNYRLAKDMFGFEKASTNRNISNQAQVVNNEIQNAGEVGMGLAGNTMDPNARAARQAQLDTMKVSGSPIG